MTDAATLRTWLETARKATLCTVLDDPRAPGFPFASAVPYALDDAGRVVVVISDLAVHTKNLARDARCSVLVEEPGAADVQAGWRVTLVGEMSRLAGAPAVAALARYRATHPQAHAQPHGPELPGFAPWALEVKAVRYIAGFGRMGWL